MTAPDDRHQKARRVKLGDGHVVAMTDVAIDDLTDPRFRRPVLLAAVQDALDALEAGWDEPVVQRLTAVDGGGAR